MAKAILITTFIVQSIIINRQLHVQRIASLSTRMPSLCLFRSQLELSDCMNNSSEYTVRTPIQSKSVIYIAVKASKLLCVSQSLPNPEFVSILVKKWIFSKGHPYSIFILVSQCSPIMLASFKSKIWNVFCPAIFLHFRMV